ncbi:APC family permease [Maritalea sp. S77]|jgi:amino acid transporter|uniref:APC family permease n=1 Tax=Maritalea sp. S77 TaxID=3415125 RepID=UPI003C7DAE2E
MESDQKEGDYKANSISLSGTVAMGTGVMIGAGIFALTGQMAELAGNLFPLSFIIGAFVTLFSAYSYIKMSNAWPSAGGIAMILQKCYGAGAVAAGAALLMALSMVIAESLVARTFATYVLRFFDISGGILVPILAVGVIFFAFIVNIAGNRSIGMISIVMAVFKIAGIGLFGGAALWASGFDFSMAQTASSNVDGFGFVASIAFGILAFKGFTTITNSGAEVENPHKNVGRAIVISILICTATYLVVAFGVNASLPIDQIIAAKDYALAEAAEPALGQIGFTLTILLAAIATASGVIASIFAVSRMLAMLTDMKMIPHSHFGMSGTIQRHTLIYTVVIASFLAIFFDLSRIASLGAFFYLVMDMLVHWGVFRHRRKEIGASPYILIAALVFDAVVLAAFSITKAGSDPTIVIIAWVAIAVVFAFERIYLGEWIASGGRHEHQS